MHPRRFSAVVIACLVVLVGAHSALACTATADRTVNICLPLAGSTVASPVTFTAAALDNEHPVTAMILYVDSVKSASSTSNQLSAALTLATGTHYIVVRAWDSSGFYFSSSENITVGTSSPPPPPPPTPTCSATTDRTVNICSPAAGSTVASPVQFTAAALDNEHPVTAMILYVDSQQTAKSTSASLSASVPLANGNHNIVIRAWDSSGYYFSSSEAITVGTTSSGGGGGTGGGSGSITAVNHIIFMMQENRSFDHYFGMLNPYRRNHGWNVGDDGKVYDVDGIDDKLASIANYDDEGQSFQPFHTSSSCLDDMTASWLESYGDVYRWAFGTSRPILMDGFVHTAENFGKSGSGSGSFTDMTGQRAMAYYQDSSTTGTPELNYYYWMASQFALSDRWFSPVSSKSIPNRIATMSGGTTQGYVHDPGSDDHAPQLGAETIFQLLDSKGISWKIYYSRTNADGSPQTTFTYFSYSSKYIYRNSSGALVIDSTHIAPISQYYTDVQNGTLPAFSYIETNYGVSDEHPGSGQSILSGQAAVAKIVNALIYSPSWSDSVFFLSYDEAGGPYDHVPPVPGQTNKFTSSYLASSEGDISSIAVNPDGYNPCLPTTPGVYTNHCDLRSGDPGSLSTDAPAVSGFAAQLGFRVPNMIISPFVRRHYVGHAAMDHTAVLHFVEQRFGLAALTKRDAAQPSLLDFFDFTNKPWATPPAQTSVPTPAVVGSSCHPSSM